MLKYYKDPETSTEEYGMMFNCPPSLIGFSYHREDGPAVITRKHEEWWYYGNIYKKAEDIPLNLFLAYIKWELKKNGK